MTRLYCGAQSLNPAAAVNSLLLNYQSHISPWGMILLRGSDLRIELLGFDPRFDDQEQ